MSAHASLQRSPSEPESRALRNAPSVADVLRGPWKAPGETTAAAAAAGADFADVRLHTDAAAGASALALGAAAYTVGRDIVFAPGAYRPETKAGQALIAHEMTHVRQQQAQPYTGGPLQLDSASSAAEHEARAAETGAAAAPQRSGLRVQRSLLGAGIGGLLGGGIGTAIGIGLGSLLGPVGMVVGGILGGLGGLIGGALLGDMASRRTRGLSSAEVSYLKEIYHASVDFSRVTITRGSALAAGAARTTGNTINLQDEHFDRDTMNLSPQGQLVLAHEMGHVWQYQNGGLAYIPSSLIPQAVAKLTGGDRNAAYDWRAMVRSKVPWAQWNAEQQAECISDYNESLRRIRGELKGQPWELKDFETVTMAEPYIALVRHRFGAPGSEQRQPGAAAGSSAAGGAEP